MFAYIDPNIRARLVAQGSLVRIDGRGRRLDPDAGHGDAPTPVLNLLGPIPLPVQLGERRIELAWYASVRSTDLEELGVLAESLRETGRQHLFASLAASMAVNSVLVSGTPAASDSPLVRVHSSCLTGDVFGSQRCECGPQFMAALDRIASDPEGGIIVYMAGHEGRGIGLWAKAVTYVLQDGGEDTYQANRSLGLPDDSRDFSDAGALLAHFLGTRPLRLLTNNPKKIADLERLGLGTITPVKHVVGVGTRNQRYLAAKRDWGHLLSAEDISAPEPR